MRVVSSPLMTKKEGWSWRKRLGERGTWGKGRGMEEGGNLRRRRRSKRAKMEEEGWTRHTPLRVRHAITRFRSNTPLCASGKEHPSTPATAFHVQHTRLRVRHSSVPHERQPFTSNKPQPRALPTQAAAFHTYTILTGGGGDPKQRSDVDKRAARNRTWWMEHTTVRPLAASWLNTRTTDSACLLSHPNSSAPPAHL